MRNGLRVHSVRIPIFVVPRSSFLPWALLAWCVKVVFGSTRARREQHRIELRVLGNNIDFL